jgi:serine protease Do
LLKVDGRSDFPYVKLADKMPRVGDWVLAVGNPFGLGGTVTAGIVSARERNIGGVSSDNLVQIDAPINKGDSGGRPKSGRKRNAELALRSPRTWECAPSHARPSMRGPVSDLIDFRRNTAMDAFRAGQA